MNFTKLTFISLSLLLMGCGGSSEGGSTLITTPETPINNIAEAKKSFKSFSSFQSIDISQKNVPTSNKLTPKLQKEIINNALSIYRYIEFPIVSMKSSNASSLLEKSGTKDCRDGGSFDYYISDAKNDMDLTLKNCKVGNKLQNGNISVRSSENKISIVYSDYTKTDIGGKQSINYTLDINIVDNRTNILANGIIKTSDNLGETSTQIIENMNLKSTLSGYNLSFLLNGKISIKSKCLNGVYNFKTIEELSIQNYRRNDYIDSGILKLNTATYTFESSYVTIETKDETETILQSELENKDSNTNSTCRE